MNPEIVKFISLSGLTPCTLLSNTPSSGPVAQLVEQLTFNQWVTGSNPGGLTIYFSFKMCSAMLAAASRLTLRETGTESDYAWLGIRIC